MYNVFLLPGTVSFRETLAIYLEGFKDFFDELLYRIIKFELKL